MTSLYYVTILFCFNAIFCSSQIDREIIKIEVDKDCKASILSKTFKDEIHTSPIRLVNSLNSVATLMFSYKENFMFVDKGPIMTLTFNKEFFTQYDTRNIFFNIDGKEFHFDQLIDFEKHEKTYTEINRTELWWGLGFY